MLFFSSGGVLHITLDLSSTLNKFESRSSLKYVMLQSQCHLLLANVLFNKHNSILRLIKDGLLTHFAKKALHVINQLFHHQT